ncbi:ATP-dependent DNA helicase [Bacillus horti]|uniref:Rad3-related DNA helicase n=1 Tax=Caldalkalibacillus horti TaxID=77523 RepID=A0ABT9VXU6_9BACI|nr:ATP-dependent DNA helicase [Bacillus horti]MDQ0165819.1 Rad3-related DNA helicase [Bacillus horti]
MHIIHLSIRSLVEFVHRSGSIDAVSFRSTRSMQEGTKAHKLVQDSQDESYKKEVYLTAEVEEQDILFQLEGRCDGLFQSNSVMTIDEIKSTSRHVDQINEDDYPVHWAQGILYAYMYASKFGEKQMNVQLTYYHLASGAKKHFQRSMLWQELEEFVQKTLEHYASFIKVRLNLKQERDATIQALSFPFPYRQGQRDFAVSVYGAILHHKRLLARAPTGIGKTISTLFPAIKALGEGKAEQIYYLTAKTITRTVAEETFTLLKEHGLKMIVVALTAKEKICFQEQVHCHKDVCEYANGYYDRINEAVLDILEHVDYIFREDIEKYARKHRICPFELSLDLTNQADCILCDYNYVFDPRVSLKRYGDEQKKRTILLVDEAHNLVDRASEMFSAGVESYSFLTAHQLLRASDYELAVASKKIYDELGRLWENERALYDGLHHVLPEQLSELIQTFTADLGEWLSGNGQSDGSQELLSLYFSCYSFLNISKLLDQHFSIIIDGNKESVHITLRCLDPSQQLKEATEKYRSTIYFSATLFPIKYYNHLLGAEEEDYRISLASPFNPSHLNVRLYPLSTRYRDREKTANQLVHVIEKLIDERKGNFLVFVPSYSYMYRIYDEFLDLSATQEKVKTLVQHEKMSEEEREDFLKAFKDDADIPVIGFAVLGGVFSEGINLKGDRLQGVVVVGVGLPQPSIVRDKMKEYFDKQNLPGREYAYVYPGMNKVLQAGGRLIRTEEDKGILALVDDRYLTPTYQSLIPHEWRHHEVKFK